MVELPFAIKPLPVCRAHAIHRHSWLSWANALGTLQARPMRTQISVSPNPKSLQGSAPENDAWYPHSGPA